MDQGNKERIKITSGSKWETLAGYSRVVRVGNLLEVAGTTAVDDRGAVVGVNDMEKQARFILEKMDNCLKQAGSRGLEDVVRTRMYVTDISKWEVVTKVHGEVFREIRPVCTLLEVSRLIQDDLLIEIEATAVMSTSQ